MKRDRTGQWVVALMFGLLMVGSAPVAVGAEEQAQEQEVEIEEEAEQATVVSADPSDAIIWVANTPEQVATEIEKQSDEKDQDPLTDYTIVWGDTLWAISLATGTTVEELAEINNIENPDLIYAGDLLTLADGTVVGITPEQEQVTQPTQTGTGGDVADNEPVEVTPDQTPENKEEDKGQGGGTGTGVVDTDKDEDDGDTGNFTPVNPDTDNEDKEEDEGTPTTPEKDDKEEDKEDTGNGEVEEPVDPEPEPEPEDPTEDEELEVIEEEVVKPETEVEEEETEPVVVPDDSGEEETPVEEPTETPVEPEDDPNVVDGDKEVTEPKDPEDEESVEISVAERTETSQIKFTEVRRENPDLPLGEERVVQEGSFGTLVKTYKVTYEDGVEVSSELVSEVVTEESVDTIIEFGTFVEEPVITTSTRTETENLPFERVTLGNPEMWEGDTEVVQTGSFGKVVREYKVTYSDGVEIQAELINETRTEPVKEVIHLGTKPEVSTKTRTETETVAFDTVERDNENLLEGQTRVAQEGVNGERIITYEQTFIRGEFDSEKQVSSEITKQPVNKIIEVGTKKKPVEEVKTVTKTETIEFDVEVIEVLDLDKGEEKVLQEGVKGEQEVVYEQVFEDGKLVKVTELSRTTTRESVTKVVEIGVDLSFDIELFGQEMLKEVNKLRASVGVAPLQYDSNLQAGVNIRADEIVDVFTHDRPDGSSPFTAFDGINSYRSRGENIARNYYSGSDTGGRTKESVMAEVFVRQYANSPGHYANMVNESYEYFATGVTVYNRINVTNAQIFGGR